MVTRDWSAPEPPLSRPVSRDELDIERMMTLATKESGLPLHFSSKPKARGNRAALATSDRTHQCE